ncbi:diguanylate cyclase [Engelhardtia mirabilis]|uniref:GGDEF domain protein n=1 Tax=Engelhardtia mirabilis TaxID=2528011 RepID=A0A518BG82_9BACT|nr:GGDEF domain protein [Planctomycetes bacterium Pla133]QDV00292.1 GGDEF domain protein [Planctomycetes bacterium Pla86]
MQHFRHSWLPRQELMELASIESGHLSLIDTLTHSDSGLYNQDFLSYKLYEETRRATRFGESLSCILLAIEESPLREGLTRVARVLRNESRDTDFPCQLDDRSFLVLMPSTPLGGAESAAARVFAQLDQLPLADRVAGPGEIAIGVASAEPGILMRGGELYDLACEALALAQGAEDFPIVSRSKQAAGVGGSARRVVERDTLNARIGT